jgi:parallel beta-helix repeat protein
MFADSSGADYLHSGLFILGELILLRRKTLHALFWLFFLVLVVALCIRVVPPLLHTVNQTSVVNITLTPTPVPNGSLPAVTTTIAVPTLPENTSYLRPGQSIQAAINEASDGATVYVGPGTYRETLSINKPITLIGIGSPVIDAGGKGNPISIAGSYATVRGFVVQGSRIERNTPDLRYAGIWIYSHHNTVSDNVVQNNHDGIALVLGAEGNILRNNTVRNNAESGIYCTSPRNTIVANNATNNTYGIRVDLTNDNLITGNLVSRNRAQGIYLQLSFENTVQENSIHDNAKEGVFISSGRKNTILRNSIVNNTGDGISILKSWEPGLFGDQMDRFSMVDSTVLSLIEGNYLQDNRHAVRTDNVTCIVHNNTIIDNIAGIYTVDTQALIYDNYLKDDWFGIIMEDTKRTVIRDNTLDKSEWGVRLAGECTSNVVRNNTLLNCTRPITDGSDVKNNNILRPNLYKMNGILVSD